MPRPRASDTRGGKRQVNAPLGGRIARSVVHHGSGRDAHTRALKLDDGRRRACAREVQDLVEDAIARGIPKLSRRHLYRVVGHELPPEVEVRSAMASSTTS